MSPYNTKMVKLMRLRSPCKGGSRDSLVRELRSAFVGPFPRFPLENGRIKELGTDSDALDKHTSFALFRSAVALRPETQDSRP